MFKWLKNLVSWLCKLPKRLWEWMRPKTVTEKALAYANSKVYNIYDFPYRLFDRKKSSRGVERSKTFRNARECKPILWNALYDHPRHGKYLLPALLGTAEGKGKKDMPTYFELYNENILVSGATRKGKTTWLTSLITSLCHFSDPEYLRVCIADHKDVSFKGMQDVCDVARSYEETSALLATLVKELKERQQYLSRSAFSQLRRMNKHAYQTRDQKLVKPYIVFLFDEFAGYVIQCQNEHKKDKHGGHLDNIDNLHSLVSRGLSNGIHLVLATQAPYQKVIEGLIKNNLTCRISFALGGAEQDRVALGVRHKEDRYTTSLKVGQFLRREAGRRVLYKGVEATDDCMRNAVCNWKRAKLSWKLKAK